MGCLAGGEGDIHPGAGTEVEPECGGYGARRRLARTGKQDRDTAQEWADSPSRLRHVPVGGFRVREPVFIAPRNAPLLLLHVGGRESRRNRGKGGIHARLAPRKRGSESVFLYDIPEIVFQLVPGIGRHRTVPDSLRDSHARGVLSFCGKGEHDPPLFDAQFPYHVAVVQPALADAHEPRAVPELLPEGGGTQGAAHDGLHLTECQRDPALAAGPEESGEGMVSPPCGFALRFELLKQYPHVIQGCGQGRGVDMVERAAEAPPMHVNHPQGEMPPARIDHHQRLPLVAQYPVPAVMAPSALPVPYSPVNAAGTRDLPLPEAALHIIEVDIGVQVRLDGAVAHRERVRKEPHPDFFLVRKRIAMAAFRIHVPIFTEYPLPFPSGVFRFAQPQEQRADVDVHLPEGLARLPDLMVGGPPVYLAVQRIYQGFLGAGIVLHRVADVFHEAPDGEVGGTGEHLRSGFVICARHEGEAVGDVHDPAFLGRQRQPALFQKIGGICPYPAGGIFRAGHEEDVIGIPHHVTVRVVYPLTIGVQPGIDVILQAVEGHVGHDRRDGTPDTHAGVGGEQLPAEDVSGFQELVKHMPRQGNVFHDPVVADVLVASADIRDEQPRRGVIARQPPFDVFVHVISRPALAVGEGLPVAPGFGHGVERVRIQALHGPVVVGLYVYAALFPVFRLYEQEPGRHGAVAYGGQRQGRGHLLVGGVPSDMVYPGSARGVAGMPHGQQPRVEGTDDTPLPSGDELAVMGVRRFRKRRLHAGEVALRLLPVDAVPQARHVGPSEMAEDGIVRLHSGQLPVCVRGAGRDDGCRTARAVRGQVDIKEYRAVVGAEHVRQHRGLRYPVFQGPAHEEIVQPPATVLPPLVPPVGPPGIFPLLVRMEVTVAVDESLFHDTGKAFAFRGLEALRIRMPAGLVDVRIGCRHVEIAAYDDRFQGAQPVQVLYETEVPQGAVIVAASRPLRIGHITVYEEELPELEGDDTALRIEGRVAHVVPHVQRGAPRKAQGAGISFTPGAERPERMVAFDLRQREHPVGLCLLERVDVRPAGAEERREAVVPCGPDAVHIPRYKLHDGFFRKSNTNAGIGQEIQAIPTFQESHDQRERREPDGSAGRGIKNGQPPNTEGCPTCNSPERSRRRPRPFINQ